MWSSITYLNEKKCIQLRVLTKSVCENMIKNRVLRLHFIYEIEIQIRQ